MSVVLSKSPSAWLLAEYDSGRAQERAFSRAFSTVQDNIASFKEDHTPNCPCLTGEDKENAGSTAPSSS